MGICCVQIPSGGNPEGFPIETFAKLWVSYKTTSSLLRLEVSEGFNRLPQYKMGHLRGMATLH